MKINNSASFIRDATCLLFLFTFLGCVDNSGEDSVLEGTECIVNNGLDTNIDPVRVDTAKAELMVECLEPEFDVADLLKKGEEVKQLPFSLDSTTIEQLEYTDTLSGQAVKVLSKGLIGGDINDHTFYKRHSFLEIDSLKAIGAYEEYQQQIDIGMTLYAEAYAHFRLNLDEDRFILVWSIYTGSYEACPYFSGSVIYGTLFVNNEVTSATVLGEMSSSSDSPVFSETLTVGYIDKDKIDVSKTYIYGEEEENGEIYQEIELNSLKIGINRGEFVIIE